MPELNQDLTDRKLSKAILLQALEIEKEQGFNKAKVYYDILLNTLGIYFHNQRRVKEFMLNRIDSAFDYFEDFTNPDYITYLENIILVRQDEIIRYHTNHINNEYYLEAITMEHDAAQNRLSNVLNNKTR